MMNIKMCEDCLECKKVKGAYVCHEMWDKPLAEIDECPLGIAQAEVDKMNEAEKVKIQHGAKDETKKRKKSERKPDFEKESIIKAMATFLENVVMNEPFENVVITNKSKIIEFDVGANHYKLDLIKTRKPKK